MGMSFDTTASNTGAKNGACVLLEKHIGRNLLYLACRHHVHELIIGGVFTVLFSPSSGPNIQLFQRFQQFWRNINHKNFRPLEDPHLELPHVKKLKEDVVQFLKEILSTKNEYMPRDDYKEMIELSLLVLGVSSEENVYHFKLPGAYHVARWMAKVIYCLKIFLFRDEFLSAYN